MRRITKDKEKLKVLKKKLLRFSKKTFTNLRNISFIIVIFQFILISSVIISEPVPIKIMLGKINRRILWSFDTLEIEDYGNYIKDFLLVLNPFSNDLERLDLSIDYENLKGLDCSREFNSYSSTNRIEETKKKCGKYWFKGVLSHNKEIYKVKIRSKGDRDIHYRNFNNMSFKVDIRGKNRLKGMEEFSIQTPMIRNYTTELFAAELMRNENIISPRNHYVRLYINGEYKGIRHLEEGFSRELIEFNKRKYGPLFSLEETINKKYIGALFDLNDSKFWENSLNQKYLPIQARTILENSKTDNAYIEKYFDLEKWAKYFAIIDAFRLWHASMPKSVKYFLNPVTGTIEPVFFDGHTNSTRALDSYNFYQLLNINDGKNNCEYICDDEDTFYTNFFGTYSNPNVKFYSQYIRNLNRITEEKYFKKNISSVWDRLRIERGSLYKDFWRIDRIHNPGIMPHVAPWKSMQKRLKTINTNLRKASYLKPEILVGNKNEKIMGIRNKFSDVPQIINLKCLDNNFQTGNLILPKNKIIDLSKNKINDCKKHRIIYSLDNFKSAYNLKEGYITDTEIAKVQIDTNQINISNKDSFKEKIIFKSGKHNIINNLEIDSKLVVFDDNTNICLEKNAIIHIKNSEVIFSKDPTKSVKISSCLNDFAGSIIIENSKVKINNLYVKNLTKPNLKFRSLDGGVNLINSDVLISKFISENSKSEDAINFVYSKVDANRIEINNAISDGIDSDFSKIKIKDINCQNIGNDCFDSSFTKGFLGQIVANNINDKALSIGEKSIISIDNTDVLDSEIGLVVKDASILKIKNFNFKNVKLPVASYIKKEEFGIPKIFIQKIYPEKTDEFLFSKDTVIQIGNNLKKSNLSSEYIESILYGNQFGVKTKR